MDSTEPHYSQKIYEGTKEINTYIKKVESNPDIVAWVPISGWNGGNMLQQSSNLPWFKGWKVTHKDGNANWYGGHLCSSVTTEVKSVEMQHEVLSKAFLGVNMGFLIKNLPLKDICCGDMTGDSKNDLWMEAADFTAQVIISDQQVKSMLDMPLCWTVSSHSCRFAELKEVIDHHSEKNLESGPKFWKSGDAAFLAKPMCIESFSDYPLLGHVAIRDMRQTVAVAVTKVADKKAAGVAKVTESAQKVQNITPNTSHPHLNQWWKNSLRTLCLNCPFNSKRLVNDNNAS
ncbi:hypothetical protein Celaphus_00000793 [Cervus elaphus hippelaphus]|uniref:GTP-eEF1A C-terminal domain-containing protein n=1 Tax=Cervus elaphus hippelaphus TaxID=46360 RepID=A0A212D8L1_CEREH|nr:hypothetical protein Celaphus_00000793 [Cervus elaphus hippelaphus]